MASLTITNVSSSDFWLNDIYATVPAGEAVVVTRSPAEISSMAGLQAAVADGVLTSAVEFSADELAADLSSVVAPASVGAVAMDPVAATDIDAPLITFRKAFTAGAAGAADDVTIYALNSLPYKVRILGAHAIIATAIGGSSLNVRSQAGGVAGVLAAGPMDSASTGVHLATGPSASVVLTPGASVGLFIRRSDRGVAGEVIITARREA